MGVHDEHLRLCAVQFHLKGQPALHLGRHRLPGQVGAVFQAARPAGQINAAAALPVMGLHHRARPLRPGLLFLRRLFRGGSRLRLPRRDLLRRGGLKHRRAFFVLLPGLGHGPGLQHLPGRLHRAGRLTQHAPRRQQRRAQRQPRCALGRQRRPGQHPAHQQAHKPCPHCRLSPFPLLLFHLYAVS